MKGSLATSTVLHAVVLGFALSSFTAPKTLEVENIESLPVSIVPIEELTQIQQGAKDARLPRGLHRFPPPARSRFPMPRTPGRTPSTSRPAEAATPSPREIVSEAPPTPAEKPAPKPDRTPEAGTEAAEAEPAPTPNRHAAESEPASTDVAALPAETTPDPVAEAIAEAAPAEPQFAALPSAGPVPQARPAPPKPRSASADRLHHGKRFQCRRGCSAAQQAGCRRGGARRSTETAALGGARTTRGNTLSQSEMDALRGQIQRFWNIIPGMADGGDVRVTVRMRLDVSGNIVGQPDVSATAGPPEPAVRCASSAKRAVLRAQPYQLPKKYDSWSEVW
jgi:hypothetical protein